MLITIIGRGHSGTRIPSKMLIDSGVYMGNVNSSYDLVPPDKLYEAARMINKKVRYLGNYKWDFSELKNPPPEKFKELINSYLNIIMKNNSENKGWKLPETTFVYPWLVKMFPNMKYIIWYRHPYDSILSPHISDNIEKWNVSFDRNDKHILTTSYRRAFSWIYQHSIINSTPEPKNVIYVKYEDFVTEPEKEVKKLEKFLGIKLNVPEVFTRSVNKWKKNLESKYKFSFLDKPIKELKYEKV